MKKLFFKISTLVIFFILSIANITIINSFAFPNIYSEGVYLMDAKTGQVLYEKNSNNQYMPASTTKIMTAILALEKCNLTDEVTISENPPKADGSSIGIEQGEVYTIEELLIGLLLESGNDCAEAIAEHIAGSNEEFAKLMNEKAKELGATNTNFKNPSGLTQEGHLTTAHDLALIMRYASQNADFVRIAQMPNYYFENHPYSDGSQKWAINHNPLLKEGSPYKYQYADCGKTGYTIAANHSYAATAIKDNQEIVGAFLNATDKNGFYTSIGQLFDWGFENFKTEKIISKGDKLEDYSINNSTKIPLISNNDVYYTLNIGNGENLSNINLSLNYDNKNLNKISIKQGDKLFTASVLVNNQKISNIDLLSGEYVKYTPSTIIKNILHSNNYFIIGIILFVILIIIIFIIISLLRHKKRRKNFLSKRSYIRNKHNF